MISEINTVTWKRGPLKIRDHWYDRTEPVWDADVIYLTQRKSPEGDEHYDQFTILVDLEQSEEGITKAISKNCIDKIKRISKKPEYSYKLLERPDRQLMDQFIIAYNEFAAWKKIAGVEKARLEALYKQGLVMISLIYLNGTDIVCWHVYRVNKERVFLIYTFTISYLIEDTTSKNNLGMANRFCHYHDLLQFKSLGIASYDFGGWYNGNLDNEKLNINKFKEEFGGEVLENYNCIYYPSLKGKVFKAMKKVKRNAKSK